MKQCPIDFFDPEVQHLAASAGCRLYRMQNDTGEGLISEYPILSGIDLFYNDFHFGTFLKGSYFRRIVQ